MNPGTDSPSATPANPLRPQPAGAAAVAWLLAAMFFVLPAFGVPVQELIQETIKSTEAAFAVLAAALVLFWQQRGAPIAWRWHWLLAVPLVLAAYAAGSAAWSHAFLAGIDLARWLVFALLFWIVLQVGAPERVERLALGLHAGITVASLWVALQFWLSFSLFPQGPNPASTFGNRNFFAEAAVTALPYGIWLLLRSRSTARIGVLAASASGIVLAIMMTGNRSALLALALQAVLLPWLAVRYRGALAVGSWTRAQQLLAIGLAALVVLGFGSIPTGNGNVVTDMNFQRVSALERAFLRGKSAANVNDESNNVRFQLWGNTAKMIRSAPWSGVGAGAWEVHLPRFQAPSENVERDFYAHNEYLQLVAEYGLVGVAALLALVFGVLRAAVTVAWLGRPAPQPDPWPAPALASVLSLLIVAFFGFALHMAVTASLLALGLAVLARAASTSRGDAAAPAAPSRGLPPLALAGLTACALALAVVFAVRGLGSEWKIIAAERLGKAVLQSDDPRAPQLEPYRAEVVRLILDATAVNPHHRRIAPMVADQLAGMGDWKNATLVWERTAGSRPYVPVLLTNVVRGYLRTGQLAEAQAWLERARAVQPQSPLVRAVEVLVAEARGDTVQALALGRQAMAAGVSDYDMFNAIVRAAGKAGDDRAAADALQARLKGWPQEDAAAGQAQLAAIQRRLGAAPPAK